MSRNCSSDQEKLVCNRDNTILCHGGKYFTMSTEFDKNFSKRSYYSPDHKDNIENFFLHCLSKLFDSQISLFGDVILGIKLFLKIKLTAFTKVELLN